MLDLDQQLRTLGRALDSAALTVSADEARQRAREGGGRLRFGGSGMRWPLAIAAAVLLIAGLSAAAVRSGDDDPDVITAQPGGYPLDLDGHRDWMLALVNGEADTSDEVLRARFEPDFLEAVAPDEIRAIAQPFAPGVPWAMSAEVERRADVLVTQLRGGNGETVRLTLLIDDSRRLAAATVLATRDCGTLPPADAAQIASDAALAWAFELINSDREVPDAELAERLSEQFLSAMPGDDFRLAMEEVRAVGPFVPRWFRGAPGARRTVLVVGTATGEEAELVVERDEAGRVDILNLTTQPPCVVP